jgi:lipoprotein-anchoring transpeptidase ErfK/SrfK
MTTADSYSAGDPPTLALVANLSTRQLTVQRDGEVIATYAVAVGAPSHPTPPGNYSVRKVVWNPGWVPPNAPWARGKKAKEPWHPSNPMKMVKIFFREPDYYIHGTAETETLGTASSHGCLRMDPSDAADVARMVMEHGGADRDPSWFEEVMSIGRTRTVPIPRAIRLTIES